MLDDTKLPVVWIGMQVGILIMGLVAGYLQIRMLTNIM